MQIRTLLVATDLTEQSYPAIIRGAEIAAKHGARLVVCHVVPVQAGSHPLFPQQHQLDVASSTVLDRQVAESLSQQVARLTSRSPAAFEILIDRGEPASTLVSQAARLGADLIVIMSDAPAAEGRAMATDTVALSACCSVLVLREGEGQCAAVVALNSEAEIVPELIRAVLAVSSPSPKRIVAILSVTEQTASTDNITGRLADDAVSMGVALETWFAALTDASALERAASDPSISLVAFAAPPPDPIVAGTSSPLEDALPEARSSLLLFRTITG
jgi:nucleotide-binding universal stress UspA family protein